MSVLQGKVTAGFLAMAYALGLLLWLALPGQAADRIIAYTGYLPPLSIDEERKGISVELMELVAEAAGLEIDIRFAPWKRAQLLAQTTPGALIFTLGQSQERREKFEYIAPLLYTESSLVTLDQPLDSFDKAIEAGKLVGVHLGSLRSRILKRSGITNFAEIPSAEQMTTMLQTGRIDAWYTMSLRASYMFRQLGYDPKRLVVGAPVTHGVQWLAANKSIEPHIRARLTKAVSKVWRDPRYWQIVDRYAG